ncbi:MAG: hypothetical protein QOI46_1708, partial [Alphaproteobacteria bacterium]|nr:hypothetical protein [Alphaproteobacteria bacterium]
AADDDPSGIATYSQAGAQFGFNLLWTMILTYPLMTSVQLVSAQIGRVTGCGLAKNIGDVFPKPLVLVLIGLLFIANTINIGANLAAMGAAVELVIGWGGHIFTVAFALKRFPLTWMQNSCHAHGVLPSPTNPGLPGLVRFILPEAGKPAAGWGGVGGGGRGLARRRCHTHHPPPQPSPSASRACPT